MGLHMVAPLVKLHWQLTAGHALRPAVAGVLASPLLLKLLMGFRVFRDEALYQSRLFLFRLSHIAFNRELPLSNVGRMERALRLIFGSVTATASTSLEDSQMEQDTFHALSLLTL